MRSSLRDAASPTRIFLLATAAIGSLGAACGGAPVLECEATIGLCSALEALAEPDVSTQEIRVDDSSRLPAGHDALGYHLQGVQPLGGGLALSGSARGGSYFFTTSPAGDVRHVERIDEAYEHAGGFQVHRGLLAVGIERQGQRAGGSHVLVFDVSEPDAPKRLDSLTLRRPTLTAGAVGILREGEEILLVAGSWDSEQLDFYRLDRAPQSTGAGWRSLGSFRADRDELGGDSIGAGWPPYQSLFLLRLDDGGLALAGLYSGARYVGRNHADFYRLELRDDRAPRLTRIARLSLPATGGRRFQSAGGLALEASPLRIGLIACDAQLAGSTARCTRWR